MLYANSLKAGSARGNWGTGGFTFSPTGLNILPPPPVWVASAVIGQVASRLTRRSDMQKTVEYTNNS